jgi:gluconolactonase
VPTPRDWTNQTPMAYPDPDIVALDPRFGRYVVFNNVIKRLHIGTGWAEGRPGTASESILVWSDIPANAQMRWIEDDGRVTTFRNNSGYSNGNTFDYEGGRSAASTASRRVARYEPNGTVTVIADKFQGKRLNSPNDVVVHPDGGVWFTDPSYGIPRQLRRVQGPSRRRRKRSIAPTRRPARWRR